MVEVRVGIGEIMDGTLGGGMEMASRLGYGGIYDVTMDEQGICVEDIIQKAGLGAVVYLLISRILTLLWLCSAISRRGGSLCSYDPSKCCHQVSCATVSELRTFLVSILRKGSRSK